MNINEWTGEPRTTAELVQDLLNIAQEHEWVEVRQYCPRGCCYERTVMECPSCEGAKPEHKPGCQRLGIILEAEAFISAEETLEREKANGVEAVPHHPA